VTTCARKPAPPGEVRALARTDRVAFTIDEAARALGTQPEALRRLVARHAKTEGDELVARLSGGIVVRRRQGLRRWLVVIPADLRS
jgi:plasmid maintenance system antidote protein VapI